MEALPVSDFDGGSGVDLISGLSDDLLVRILELLPDATDVLLTQAISRRWRGLWTGVAALRFDSESWPAEVHSEAGAARQYLAFVDDTLALRANATTTRRRCCGVKDLEISFDISGRETEELALPSFKAAQGWIRYAAQHEVRSLALHLDLAMWYADLLPQEDDYYDEDADLLPQEDDYYDEDGYDEDVEEDPIPAMAINDLASYSELEILDLTLGGAKLCLFSSSSTSTVVFSSLTDVSLKDMIVEGHLLSQLVSTPCCPCLRKLQLTNLHFCTVANLLLEGDTLLELSLGRIHNIESLELRTPSLEVLHVEPCHYLEKFTVSAASRLEDLMFVTYLPLRIVDVHGHLSSVETLKIRLSSHGNINGDDQNDGSIQLLQCCRLTRCLEVSLEVLKAPYRKCDIIKGRIPSLPHITSLTVEVTMEEPHNYGASIAGLLAQCNNIRYLSLRVTQPSLQEDRYLCDNSCQWKSYEFSLAHLQEAEFENLVGTDCELQFIRSILKRESGVQKVAISFDKHYWRKNNRDAFKLMPPLDGGSWTTCNNADLSYKWRRYCE